MRQHALIEVGDGAAAGIDEKKRKQSMQHARAPTGQHAQPESTGREEMLKVVFTDAGRVFGEQSACCSHGPGDSKGVAAQIVCIICAKLAVV